MKKTYILLLLLFPAFLKAQVSLTDGLTACFPFSGDAMDASGNGNNGTVSGAALTSDRQGSANNAYLFNGTSDYIEVPGKVISSKEFAISFWAKTINFQSQMAFMLVPDNPSDRFAISINYNHNSDTAVFWDFGDIYGTGRAFAYYPVSYLNTWEHYVFTVSNASDSMIVYRNGQVLVAMQTSDVLSDTSRALRIGSGNSANHFSGAIDDIRIYSRPLDASEVQDLYTGNPSCIEVPTEIAENTAKTGAVIFPNPFGERATVQITAAQGAVYTLDLYDISGKLLKRMEGIREEATIEKDQLQPGFYFYKIYNESHSLATGKLLIN